MGTCCTCCSQETDSYSPQLSDQEKAERRDKQAAAAEARAKNFSQGGGGEKLKAKQKALEEAERKNKEGGENKLKWSTQ